MDGFLLVDKPAGISSFGVVARVRRAISELTGQKTKIGHTGTLDPSATGLMILVVGKYTKRASQFSKLDKTYEAEVILGQTSTTGDNEGELSVISDKKPSIQAVKAVLEEFEGEIQQIPHKFSAVKVGGQRAYKLARAGQEVKLEPRQVTIYAITDVKYDYPQLKFTAKVSSGTYVRSLAEDIGQKLGTGAYLSNLRRTTVGEYDIADAISMDNTDFLSNLKS